MDQEQRGQLKQQINELALKFQNSPQHMEDQLKYNQDLSQMNDLDLRQTLQKAQMLYQGHVPRSDTSFESLLKNVRTSDQKTTKKLIAIYEVMKNQNNQMSVQVRLMKFGKNKALCQLKRKKARQALIARGDWDGRVLK